VIDVGSVPLRALPALFQELPLQHIHAIDTLLLSILNLGNVLKNEKPSDKLAGKVLSLTPRSYFNDFRV
jgi:hypothetical protein